ncbi:MAG TPA: 50S ribosomal protein L29 [Vicinamibacterales bacterium]|jgi:large subunit ribosomal protein L29
MKASEIRDLSLEELRTREHDLQDELFRLRIKSSMGEVEAQGRLRSARHDLARVKTVLRERA